MMSNGQDATSEPRIRDSAADPARETGPTKRDRRFGPRNPGIVRESGGRGPTSGTGEQARIERESVTVIDTGSTERTERASDSGPRERNIGAQIDPISRPIEAESTVLKGSRKSPKQPEHKPEKAGEDKPRTSSFSGEQVEKGIVLIFALVSMIRQRPYWAVQNPAVEIRPWSQEAAELLNQIPATYATAVLGWGSALTVAAGLGSMVYVRLRADDVLDRQERQTTQQAEPQETGQSDGTGTAAMAGSYRPGTGAAPTPVVVQGLSGDGFAAA